MWNFTKNKKFRKYHTRLRNKTSPTPKLRAVFWGKNCSFSGSFTNSIIRSFAGYIRNHISNRLVSPFFPHPKQDFPRSRARHIGFRQRTGKFKSTEHCIPNIGSLRKFNLEGSWLLA